MRRFLTVFMATWIACVSCDAKTKKEETKKDTSIPDAPKAPLISGLFLPQSTLERPGDTQEAVVIQASPGDIVIGERKIIAINDGVVDGKYKRGGATGLVIVPVMQRMQEEADRAKEKARKLNRKFDTQVVLALDHEAPYRLLVELVQSSIAEFKHFALMTQNTDALLASGTSVEALPTVNEVSLLDLPMPRPQFGAPSFPLPPPDACGYVGEFGMILPDEEEEPLEEPDPAPTSPEDGATATPEPPEPEPEPPSVPNPPGVLRIGVTQEGFVLFASGVRVPSGDEGCAEATVCVSSPDAADPLERYDWLTLYNTLLELKGRYPADQDCTRLEVTLSASLPISVLVRTLDVARYQLRSKDAADDATALALKTLEGAKPVVVEGQPRDLFSNVLLGMPLPAR